MNFKNLHKSTDPILICNVWDVASARVAEELRFQAIGTSSGAIADMLGYKDGEEISFDEVAYIVDRIAKSVDVTLSVDLEAGYSRDPAIIVDNIKRLEQLGVVGVNIEDSIVAKTREISPIDEFLKILEVVRGALSKDNVDMFMNIRTDTFLLGLPNHIDQTIERARRYAEVGANGLFVPCIEKEEDIARLIDEIDLPLNIMCMPCLPDFSTLKELGVKRISMGNFVYNKANESLKKQLEEIQMSSSFQSLFS